MEFQGILLKKIDDREGDGQHGHWHMASFLLETVGMYPRKMVVDVSDGVGGRIAQFEALLGKMVQIDFDPNATEYNGKWYNKFTAYRIADYAELKAKQLEQSAAVAHQPTGQQPAAATAPEPAPPAEGNDGLPF